MSLITKMIRAKMKAQLQIDQLDKVIFKIDLIKKQVDCEYSGIHEKEPFKGKSASVLSEVEEFYQILMDKVKPELKKRKVIVEKYDALFWIADFENKIFTATVFFQDEKGQKMREVIPVQL